MNELIFMACGIFGVLAHCLMKANSLSKDAKVANVDYSVKKYLKDDWAGISLSFLWVVVWLLIFQEPAKKYPIILDFVRASFFFSGMMGSYILQTILSRGKKKIRSVVDEKTDKADGKD